jgi:L-lactate utilization protein LutC
MDQQPSLPPACREVVHGSMAGLRKQVTDRGVFLDMVAGTLGKPRGRAVAAEVTTHLSGTREDVLRLAEEASRTARGETQARALMDALRKSAGDVGWVVHRVESHEDAAEAVLEICKAAGARKALRSDMPVFERVPIDQALRTAGIELSIAARPSGEPYTDEARMRVREAAFTADIGITGADYAVAETGTLVLHPRRGLSRLVSLAPPRHIAIVERGQVLPSLDELFLIQRASFLDGSLTSSFNLISGPSKTGDIGATIVEGVHGPLQVHMILVGW